MQTAYPRKFWHDLERRIAAQTETVLNAAPRHREPVIQYLREVDELARNEGARRETLQMIASARRILGDRSEAGPRRGSSS